MAWELSVLGGDGQSTPGWKWRRIVYQQNTRIHQQDLYQRFSNCQAGLFFIIVTL